MQKRNINSSYIQDIHVIKIHLFYRFIYIIYHILPVIMSVFYGKAYSSRK